MIGGEKSKLIYQMFLATFDWKIGVATTHAPNDLESLNPAKKLAHWLNLLGQPLSRNHIFEISRVNPP